MCTHCTHCIIYVYCTIHTHTCVQLAFASATARKGTKREQPKCVQSKGVNQSLLTILDNLDNTEVEDFKLHSVCSVRAFHIEPQISVLPYICYCTYYGWGSYKCTTVSLAYCSNDTLHMCFHLWKLQHWGMLHTVIKHVAKIHLCNILLKLT